MFDFRANHNDGQVNLFVDRVELATLWGYPHHVTKLAILAKVGFALGADIAFLDPN
jgi:hypothetical protein